MLSIEKSPSRCVNVPLSHSCTRATLFVIRSTHVAMKSNENFFWNFVISFLISVIISSNKYYFFSINLLLFTGCSTSRLHVRTRVVGKSNKCRNVCRINANYIHITMKLQPLKSTIKRLTHHFKIQWERASANEIRCEVFCNFPTTKIHRQSKVQVQSLFLGTVYMYTTKHAKW